MPIERLTPTHLVQVCAGCNARHTISLWRGAQKTRPGPFVLEHDATLEIAVDGSAAVTVQLRATGFADPRKIVPAELARVLNAGLPALEAYEDFGGCVLESRTEGNESRVVVRSGSACQALGLEAGETDSRSGCPPVLGAVIGDLHEPNLIFLRVCSCGATEVLLRNFDGAPPHVAGSFFDLHRRAVNSLGELLRRRGASHPTLRAHYERNDAAPPDLLTDVLGRGSADVELRADRHRAGEGG